MSEIKLPEKFSVDGYRRELVERSGDLAIYRVIGNTGKPICFDAVKIVHKPDRAVMGKSVSARESYPKPSQWGDTAWSCPTLERARERINQLQARFPLRSKDKNPPGIPPGSIGQECG